MQKAVAALIVISAILASLLAVQVVARDASIALEELHHQASAKTMHVVTQNDDGKYDHP